MLDVFNYPRGNASPTITAAQALTVGHAVSPELEHVTHGTGS